MMRRVEEDVRGGNGHFFDTVSVDSEPGCTGVVISLGKRFPSGWVGNCNLVIETPPSDEKASAPSYGSRMYHSLTEGEAQALVDALFKAGVTPTGFVPAKTAPEQETYSSGKVEAMKEHLADLRRMAFRDPLPEEPLGPDQPRTGRSETI